MEFQLDAINSKKLEKQYQIELLSNLEQQGRLVSAVKLYLAIYRLV